MATTKFHTLGTAQIPRGMVWSDEHDWGPVQKAVERSITGALLIDVGTLQAGRPITLTAESDAGWITRAALQALQALAAMPDANYVLTLADGRAFDVTFADGQAITAKPVGRPELPQDNHPHVATVRLITV